MPITGSCKCRVKIPSLDAGKISPVVALPENKGKLDLTKCPQRIGFFEFGTSEMRMSANSVNSRKCCTIIYELLKPPHRPQHINRLDCGRCVSQWLSAKLKFEGGCWGRRVFVLFCAFPDRKIIIFLSGYGLREGDSVQLGVLAGNSGCFWPESPDSARSPQHEWVCDDVHEGQCPERMWWNQARVPPRAASMTDRAHHHQPTRSWNKLTVNSITC